MIWFDMLCVYMLCDVTIWYDVMWYVDRVLWYDMSWCVVAWNDVLCDVALCYGWLCYVMR